MQRLVLLALVGASAVAAQDINAIKACVDAAIVTSTSKFAGNASCPATCAHCHAETPEGCPAECRNKNIFCACSGIMMQAVSDSRVCCTQQQGLLAVACNFAIDEIATVCMGLTSVMCDGLVARVSAATPSLIDVVGNAFSRAATQAGAGADSAAAYVSGHSKGAACVSLLDDIEQEHAKEGASEEMPDLLAAAETIAERSSGILGREMPALKDKVHRAMATAWTENGPGMGSEEICEVVLRHHDAL